MYWADLTARKVGTGQKEEKQTEAIRKWEIIGRAPSLLLARWKSTSNQTGCRAVQRQFSPLVSHDCPTSPKTPCRKPPKNPTFRTRGLGQLHLPVCLSHTMLATRLDHGIPQGNLVPVQWWQPNRLPKNNRIITREGNDRPRQQTATQIGNGSASALRIPHKSRLNTVQTVWQASAGYILWYGWWCHKSHARQWWDRLLEMCLLEGQWEILTNVHSQYVPVREVWFLGEDRVRSI